MAQNMFIASLCPSVRPSVRLSVCLSVCLKPIFGRLRTKFDDDADPNNKVRPHASKPFNSDFDFFFTVYRFALTGLEKLIFT